MYKTIGNVGGIGHEAGIDIVEPVFRKTAKRPENEKPNVILHSLPSVIPSRNYFLIDLALS